MKRIPQHELLDNDEGTSAEIATSFRDLRLINRWFGGISTSRSLLRQAMLNVAIDRAKLLEVAAGDAYSIRQAVRSLNHSSHITITALDRNSSHIEGNGDIKTVVGDALQLPFANDSFDFVSCALFLHHLSSDEVIRFVTEALRVSRHAVLINDLRRSPVHLALVYIGQPLFRSRITRHDSLASVRQAYTPVEVRELLAKTPASRAEVKSHYLFRMAAIAWK